MTAELEMYRFLVDNVSDGVYLVDRDRTITMWNRGASAISGYADEDVIGRRCRDGILNHVDDTGRLLCATGCPLAATMIDGQRREAHVWMTKSDGSRLPVRVKATPVHGPDGAIVGAMEVFTDDTPMLEAQSRAARLTQTDGVDQLTGLGSRVRLAADLTNHCENWERHGWPFGLLLVDIDRLGAIDAKHGTAVAEQAVALVARTMAQTLPQAAALARYDDDQFAVLLPCHDAAELRKLAVRLWRMVTVSRLMVDGQRLRLTVSLGGTMAMAKEVPDTILHRASSLLHEAQQTDRDKVVIDIPAMESTAETPHRNYAGGGSPIRFTPSSRDRRV
jgi:diguanylate cyclase (GGDEF)-like protein/PAS domain S-box-containing protein